MEFSEGDIVIGKIKSIMKFGAFVTLPGEKSGLVHISEISSTYVNDIRDCLTEGQEVKVKVLSVENNGRINLSIKKAQAPPVIADKNIRSEKQASSAMAPHKKVSEENSFEDKLKAFMKDSESRFSDMKYPPEKKNPRRIRTK